MAQSERPLVAKVNSHEIHAYLHNNTASNILDVLEISRARVLQLTNCQNSRRRFLCVALILLAVCMLTVRVATRYCFSRGSSDSATITLRNQGVARSSLQRITKGAPAWMPPVVRTAILQAPSSYPRVAPSGPPVPGLVFEESLYNRPPPIC
jgi:hypothetical protein